MNDDSDSKVSGRNDRLSDLRGSLNAGKRAAKNRKVLVFTLLQRGAGTQERVFRLDKERVVIGSVISADVRLHGEGVSPIHAVVELVGDGLTGSNVPTIYDLASETGVFVNGTKVVTHTLGAGDELTIGHLYLKFHLEDLAETARLRPRESEGRRLFVNPSEDIGSLLLENEREVEEIFDYRPTSLTALEVVMSYGGTILAVEHFVDERKITIGNGRSCHFGIPPLISSSEHLLVTREGDSFDLNIDTQMKGVVQRNGRLQTFEAVRAEAPRGPYGFRVPLGRNDFAKLSIGEIDFYLSFTAAPPRLKLGKMFERDPLFLRIFLSSMLLTVLTVTALLKASVPQNLEAEQIPERIATILYAPEKYASLSQPRIRDVAQPEQPSEPVKTPQPVQTTKLDITPNPNNMGKPVPAQLTGATTGQQNKQQAAANKAKSGRKQEASKEGKGARAHGKEGERGTRTAQAAKDKQTAAARPAPEGGKGLGKGDSQVPDEGNVDVLKDATAKLENILGNSAAHLGKGGEKLKGFGGFDTRGRDGLALTGGGKGGGGDAASLGGLANQGRGGGRVGTGLGAAGSGAGIIGGSTRVVIRTGGSEEAVVMGAIDADAVEAALLAHRDEFRLCYEREINAENPAQSGRVGTTFVIGSSGKVTQAGIESTSLKNANTERCVLTVIRRIDFPMPRGGGIVQVSYPFKFSAIGR